MIKAPILPKPVPVRKAVPGEPQAAKPPRAGPSCVRLAGASSPWEPEAQGGRGLKDTGSGVDPDAVETTAGAAGLPVPATRDEFLPRSAGNGSGVVPMKIAPGEGIPIDAG